MSECKNIICEDEASFAYADNYCSSTCQIMYLEKENQALREKWEVLNKWVKGRKINFSGEDRFWCGYDDFHGDVRAKIKDLDQS